MLLSEKTVTQYAKSKRRTIIFKLRLTRIQVKEGNKLPLGSETIEIYDVPGHSPGSVAFYNQNNGFVISGDALFMMSIGRTDLYKGDYDQLISSIKTKLLTLPENTKVYSGHGESTTIGFEKEHNPFLN